MIKEKPCKPIGKAIGYKDACGNLTPVGFLKYGLCPTCYPDFIMNTDAGKVIFYKSVLPKAKSNLKKESKAKDKAAREKIKTKSDYEKDLQKEVNTIVRLIDKGTCCISTRKPLNAKHDSGHFYSVGSTPALRFNLFNIYAQSVYANQYLSGDQINFLSGLRHFYGSEHGEYVLSLKSRYTLLKLSIDELKQATKIAREIVKELKADDRAYNPSERLELRLQFNKKIGIYYQDTNQP